MLAKLNSTLVAQAAGASMTVGVGFWLAYAMEVEAYGSFSAWLSVVTVCGAILMAGVPNSITSTISGKWDSHPGFVRATVRWSSLTILRRLAVITVLAAVVCSFYYDFSAYNGALFFLGIVASASKAIQAQQAAVINTLSHHARAALLLTFWTGFFVTVLTFLVKDLIPLSVVIVASCQALASALCCLPSIRLVQRKLISSQVTAYSNPPIADFAVTVVIQTLNFQLGLLWLAQFFSASETAEFRVGLMIATVPTILSAAMVLLAQPTLAQLYNSKKYLTYKRQARKFILSSSGGSLLLAVILLPNVQFIVNILFDEKYATAGALGFILLLGSIVACATSTVPVALNMCGRQSLVRNASVGALLTHLLMLCAFGNSAEGVALTFIGYNVVYGLLCVICLILTFRALENDNNCS